jgi:hypothetical protein
MAAECVRIPTPNCIPNFNTGSQCLPRFFRLFPPPIATIKWPIGGIDHFINVLFRIIQTITQWTPRQFARNVDAMKFQPSKSILTQWLSLQNKFFFNISSNDIPIVAYLLQI